MSSLKGDNAILLQGGANTLCCVFMAAFAHACLCTSMHERVCVWQIKRGQKRKKIPEIINWVLFVLPLSMMSYTTESERSLPWPRVHEPWKNDTSIRGDERGGSVMSHRTEGRLLPVNLSGWPDASANAASHCGVAVALPSSPLPLVVPAEYFHIPWLWKHR